MPKGHIHSSKWHRCWEKVQAQGHDAASAAAICTASIGEASFNEGFTQEERDAVTAEELRAAASTPRLRDVHLVAAAGKIRTGQYRGREHVVVPLTALVEGVLHAVNSKDPELVLAEEFSLAYTSWNGRPVMMNHPERQGRKISANDPSVLEATQLGQVFNAKIVGKTLQMEAWIDPERAKAVGDEGERLLERIKTADPNDPLEVSVGVFMVAEHKAGEYNGKPYKAIWRHITPDHLATLSEGRTGACSVEMGCGTRFLTTAEGYEEVQPRAACSCGGTSPTQLTPEQIATSIHLGDKQYADSVISNALIADTIVRRTLAGMGRGNWGHVGRPGQIGGSGGGIKPNASKMGGGPGQKTYNAVHDKASGFHDTTKDLSKQDIHNAHFTTKEMSQLKNEHLSQFWHGAKAGAEGSSAHHFQDDINNYLEPGARQAWVAGHQYGREEGVRSSKRGYKERKLEHADTRIANAIVRRTLGGAGSGNFGHSGRPGEVGGSGGGGHEDGGHEVETHPSKTLATKRYGVTLHVNDNMGINAVKNTKTVMSYHSSLAEAKRSAANSHGRRLVHDFKTGTIVHDTRKSPGQVYNSPTMKGRSSGNLHSSDGKQIIGYAKSF